MRRFALITLVLGSAALAAGCNAPQVSNAATESPTPTGSGSPTPTGTQPQTTLCSDGGTVGISGGSVPCLSFAIVGDTRPASVDDNAGYPKSIITTIYQKVNGLSSKPSFVVGTGDYQFSSKNSSNAAIQMGYYMTARGDYAGTFFPAMGNHECTGYTDSNCGTGNVDGVTNNYTAFMNTMLAPISQTKPYYVINVNAQDSSWTAKFVFIAANAWNSTQATWLTNALSQPTTYTFVVRHEGINANTAPGVTPSQTIIQQHPYTMLLEGHTHTMAYYASDKEVITGNGGAPLTGSMNYGYVLVRQRSDGAIDFSAQDFTTGSVMKHFVVTKDGGATN